MLNIFAYDFMIKAFIAAALIAVIAPCIGMTTVLKRLSAIGDAASHSALAGIACGLVFNFNPVLGAVVFSLFAVLCIEGLRSVFKRYSEIATVVVMSAGIGLTAVLSGFIKGGGANLNSFLFGSIVAVSDFELYLTLGLCAAVLAVSLLLYKEIFAITFDEESAALAGVPVKSINFVFVCLTALTVSVSARIVGALMISSLLVLPAATAMMLGKSYKKTLVLSIVFALFSTIAGLFVSFYMALSTGGTIVLLSVLMLAAVSIVTGRRK